MTGKPLDAVGIDPAESKLGKIDFHPDDGITVANWRNSVLARRDDVTSFVKWVKGQPDLDEPVKKLVSALATEFNRERGR